MGIRESQLVRYCHWCSIVIAVSICCSSSLSNPTTSSLKGSLSFMPDRSHLQRLRACALFPMAFSVPPSVERNPSCLASLPSNSRLLALKSQHCSSQWTMCLPGTLFAYIAAHPGIVWLLLIFFLFILLFPVMAFHWGSLPHCLLPSPLFE